MFKLNAHSSNFDDTHHISYSHLFLDSSVVFDFFITSNNSVNVSNKYVSKYKNWSLWDHDVVEVFLSFGSTSYLEVQLSALNQIFCLQVIKPRSEFFYPDKCTITSSATVDGGNWQARLEVPYSMIPGNKSTLYANIFACLGRPKNYYAKNINPENRPDFHRPDLFTIIGDVLER